MYSPIGWARAVAALFTTTSMPPNSSTARRTSSARSSRSPMWAGTPIASPPSAAQVLLGLLAGVRLAAGHDDLAPRRHA